MRYTRQMEAEQPVTDEKKPSTIQDAPVYNFDGFKIEMNEKVSLTPIQWGKKKKHG